MCPKEYVSVGCHLLPALSRLPVETTAEDPGLCSSPSILGSEGQSASAWWIRLFGNVCSWVKVAYEKVHDLQWPWHLWGPNAGVTWSGSWGGPPAWPHQTSTGRWPSNFKRCTFCIHEYVSHSDHYPCWVKGGVSGPCHHTCWIGRWAGWSSHPLQKQLVMWGVWQNWNIQNGSKYIHLIWQPLWGVFPPTQETSGGTTTTIAPIGGKELSTTWRKNSGPSEVPPAQPHLEAPWSQHPKRRKTQELTKGATPKFQEIAKSLTAGKSPDIEVGCPLTEASQDLLVGSTVATVTSTTMHQDQTMGII